VSTGRVSAAGPGVLTVQVSSRIPTSISVYRRVSLRCSLFDISNDSQVQLSSDLYIDHT
jgi:hypothetical protein